jgi:hypothetical protein
MDVAGALATITAAIGLAKELRDIDRQFHMAALRLKIVELTDALATAKAALLEAESVFETSMRKSVVFGLSWPSKRHSLSNAGSSAFSRMRLVIQKLGRFVPNAKSEVTIWRSFRTGARERAHRLLLPRGQSKLRTSCSARLTAGKPVRRACCECGRYGYERVDTDLGPAEPQATRASR